MIKYSFLAGMLSILLFACSNKEQQPSDNADAPAMIQYKKDQRNKAVVLKCISAYAVSDSNYILAQNANDVVNIYSGEPPIHGIDSCRIVLRKAFDLIKEYQPGNQVALADNNYVFVFQYVDLSFKKNDLISHSRLVEIFKFNDEGKIILHTAIGEDLGPRDERISF
jgi:hypothetical protein